MRFEGIRLLVEDFDTAFRFYSEALGFKIVWGKPGDVYGSFSVSDHVSLSIFTAEYMDQALDIPATTQRRAMDNGVLIFSAEDVDIIHKELLEKGVPILKEPTDMAGWGCRTLHIRDTEGNLIEFNSALPEEKWDEDLKEAAKEYN